MTESLSYAILFLISTTIALFITGMLLLFIVTGAIKWYQKDAKAHEKLVDACKKGRLNQVKNIMEPITLIKTNVLEQTTTYKDGQRTVSQKEVLVQAFQTACKHQNHPIVQYLSAQPKVQKAVSEYDLDSTLKIVCGTQHPGMTKHFLIRWKASIEQSFFHDKAKLISIVMKTNQPQAVGHLLAAYPDTKNTLKNNLDDFYMHCCSNDLDRIVNMLFRQVTPLQHSLLLSRGFDAACNHQSLSVFTLYLDSERLRKYCMLSIPGILGFIRKKMDVTESLHQLMDIPHVASDITSRIELSYHILNEFGNTDMLSIGEIETILANLLHDVAVKQINTTYEVTEKLAYAFFVINQPVKAWECIRRFIDNKKHYGGIIKLNQASIIKHIASVPVALAIELYCNPTFREFILSDRAAHAAFKDILLHHPVINAYTEGECDQAKFRHTVFESCQYDEAELHRKFSEIAPDDLKLTIEMSLLEQRTEDLTKLLSGIQDKAASLA